MTLFMGNQKLLEAFRRGDREALEAVYRAYLDNVATLVRVGFCSTREPVVVVSGVHNPQAQCDLIQETFVRAFSKTARSGYDGLSPFRPYLLRIAKNLMIDALRKRGREYSESVLNSAVGAATLEGLLDQDAQLWARDPAEEAEEEKLAAETHSFITSLEEPERTFFGLRYDSGLSQEEVALRMGITRRKVRTLEGRLRRGLKRHLQCQGLLT